MSWYSQYHGKSIGRVLHCLSVYCEGEINIRIDEVRVGDGKVTYYSETLATYVWEEPDIPVFTFFNLKYYTSVPYILTRSQFIKKPFLDDSTFLALQNINYTVQEIQNLLTLKEALQAIFVRDVKEAINPFNKEFKNKIQKRLQLCYYNRLTEKQLDDYWFHFVLAAIYNLSERRY